MINSKWNDWKLSTKKQDFRSGKNISRNSSEIWRHSLLIMQCCLKTKHKREMDERSHPSFSPKSDLIITKNFRGIILTALAVKFYNALLLNHIWPKIKKVLRENQNNFQRNYTTSKFLRIHQSIGKESQDNTTVYFSKAFWSHTQRKDGEKNYLHMIFPKKLLPW